ncbi:mannonate dehydratase [Radiobacillus kanasensis]|uniref:mannonate dehydratase n=1 Tax=Radiobacillus kanasensis TaxID=2844358 RepID=UPI001E39CB54|nr:mannonate dehydratase [Radiobacillus kanasensis]UFU00787.1 mannonate dehydratase [Radiobacillus kanasensis]
MKITFRWFGESEDTVTLRQIRQIPGVDGIVGVIFDTPAGEVWSLEKVQQLKQTVLDSELNLEVIESVNVHEDIKLGLPTRDTYIENYQETLRNLATIGVKVVCYNFMPIFDWTRTDLAKALPDGSHALAFENGLIEGINPVELAERVENNSNGYPLPGWEPERMKTIKQLFKLYEQVNEEDLFNNLHYFLERVVPVAEECDIKLAIHPDDPPWSVFNLPRIVTNQRNLERIVNLVDSPYNGLTLCSGSLGANPNNNVPEIFREFLKRDRVPFVHVRNIKREENGDFSESSHRGQDGSLDIYEIVKALHDYDFGGYLRPDHGRMIWDEQARPGYGLYDRALGIMYILGIWDSLTKQKVVTLEGIEEMS